MSILPKDMIDATELGTAWNLGGVSETMIGLRAALEDQLEHKRKKEI